MVRTPSVQVRSSSVHRPGNADGPGGVTHSAGPLVTRSLLPGRLAPGHQTRRELLDERNKLQAQVELEFIANPQKLAEALRAAFKQVDPELK